MKLNGKILLRTINIHICGISNAIIIKIDYNLHKYAQIYYRSFTSIIAYSYFYF